MDPSALAASLVRTTLSLAGGELRAAYLADAARAWPTEVFAAALDVVCARAEQAEASAREALMAGGDAFNRDGMGGIVQRLPGQAAGGSLPALERGPSGPGAPPPAPPPPGA